jgi:vacuolar-type H+-ATPase subunit E/Vma4
MRRNGSVNAVVALFSAIAMSTLGCSQQTVDRVTDSVQDAAGDAQQVAGEAVQAASETAGDVSAAVEEGFSSAFDKASAALESVAGGDELMTGLKDLFASAKESFEGITDSATADAAVSKFGELSNSVDGLAAMIEKLPAEAKPAVQSVIQQGIAQLKALADKVLAISGVQDVLKPSVDHLMAKLQAVAGEPTAQ